MLKKEITQGKMLSIFFIKETAELFLHLLCPQSAKLAFTQANGSRYTGIINLRQNAK
jgi:hypothetical protein